MSFKNKIFTIKDYPKLQFFVILTLRVVVGYHFLYEGISKFLLNSWSAKVFLIQSNWIFAKTFQFIANSPSLLAITNLLNIWGQIFIGLGLILGLFTKYAAYAGALLLLFYYVAYPPFATNNIFVDRNFLELIGLIAVAVFPTSNRIGLDGLLNKMGIIKNG